MPAAKPVRGTLKVEMNLEELLGSAWAGFFLRPGRDGQGLLLNPMWRQPISAGELKALFYRCQSVDLLSHQLRRTQRELERAHTIVEGYEVALAFYRRELRSASKLGLMFFPLEHVHPAPPADCTDCT